MNTQAWGKCDAAWMNDGGFCKLTCGRCDDAGQKRVVLQKATVPVTLEKASVGTSASASVQTGANAKVKRCRSAKTYDTSLQLCNL